VYNGSSATDCDSVIRFVQADPHIGITTMFDSSISSHEQIQLRQFRHRLIDRIVQAQHCRVSNVDDNNYPLDNYHWQMDIENNAKTVDYVGKLVNNRWSGSLEWSIKYLHYCVDDHPTTPFVAGPTPDWTANSNYLENLLYELSLITTSYGGRYLLITNVIYDQLNAIQLSEKNEFELIVVGNRFATESMVYEKLIAMLPNNVSSPHHIYYFASTMQLLEQFDARLSFCSDQLPSATYLSTRSYTSNIIDSNLEEKWINANRSKILYLILTMLTQTIYIIIAIGIIYWRYLSKIIRNYIISKNKLAFFSQNYQKWKLSPMNDIRVDSKCLIHKGKWSNIYDGMMIIAAKQIISL
jgi:hypothetical protein